MEANSGVNTVGKTGDGVAYITATCYYSFTGSPSMSGLARVCLRDTQRQLFCNRVTQQYHALVLLNALWVIGLVSPRQSWLRAITIITL